MGYEPDKRSGGSTAIPDDGRRGSDECRWRFGARRSHSALNAPLASVKSLRSATNPSSCSMAYWRRPAALFSMTPRTFGSLVAKIRRLRSPAASSASLPRSGASVARGLTSTRPIKPSAVIPADCTRSRSAFAAAALARSAAACSSARAAASRRLAEYWVPIRRKKSGIDMSRVSTQSAAEIHADWVDTRDMSMPDFLRRIGTQYSASRRDAAARADEHAAAERAKAAAANALRDRVQSAGITAEGL